MDELFTSVWMLKVWEVYFWMIVCLENETSSALICLCICVFLLLCCANAVDLRVCFQCYYLLQYHVIFSFKWGRYPRADEVEQGANVKRSTTQHNSHRGDKNVIPSEASTVFVGEGAQCFPHKPHSKHVWLHRSNAVVVFSGCAGRQRAQNRLCQGRRGALRSKRSSFRMAQRLSEGWTLNAPLPRSNKQR